MLALWLRPERNDEYRKYWNMYHHILGYSLLVVSSYNIFRGIRIMSPELRWKWAYVGILAALGCIVLALEIYTWYAFISKKEKEKKKKEEEEKKKQEEEEKKKQGEEKKKKQEEEEKKKREEEEKKKREEEEKKKRGEEETKKQGEEETKKQGEEEKKKQEEKKKKEEENVNEDKK